MRVTNTLIYKYTKTERMEQKTQRSRVLENLAVATVGNNCSPFMEHRFTSLSCLEPDQPSTHVTPLTYL